MFPASLKFCVGVGERDVHMALAVLQPSLFHAGRRRRDPRQPLSDQSRIDRRALRLEIERATKGPDAGTDVRPAFRRQRVVGINRREESGDRRWHGAFITAREQS